MHTKPLFRAICQVECSCTLTALYLHVGFFLFQLNVLIDTGSSNLAIACKEDETIDKYFMPEK